MNHIYPYNIIKRTDTVYYSNSTTPVTTRTTYGYNSYNQKNKIEFTDSDGKEYMKKYKYVGDYNRYLPSDPVLPDKYFIYSLTGKNMIGYLVEEQTLIKKRRKLGFNKWNSCQICGFQWFWYD
jgi:hypothetical protein